MNKQRQRQRRRQQFVRSMAQQEDVGKILGDKILEGASDVIAGMLYIMSFILAVSVGMAVISML